MEQRLPEPVKLHEEVTKCPVCGKQTLHVVIYVYRVPLVGDIVMTTGKCTNCGFTFRDVRVAEQKQPQRLILDVESPEDLNSLVVRAPSATVKVRGISDEGDLEMKPGPIADGFITTVEGVLHRFKDILEFLCEEPDVDKAKCKNILEKLKEAIEGRRKFQLIIEDPEGVSAIGSKKVRVEPLNREEAGRKDAKRG